MNILFLTMSRFYGLDAGNIYSDLLFELSLKGHKPYIVAPAEEASSAGFYDHGGYAVLKVQTGELSSASTVKKGIATVGLAGAYKRAIDKHLGGIKFPLILYSTPPVTLAGVVAYVKKRNNAVTFLLLKDIFPQNAVDLGMLKETGAKGLIYSYFRATEKRLYKTADFIGCMSEANVSYVLGHNPEISAAKVIVSPNCVKIRRTSVSAKERRDIRERYGLDVDARIFIYGGNLGKPQGMGAALRCIKACADLDALFLIVGSGTEYALVEREIQNIQNARLMSALERSEFEKLVAACDAGLIFLDERFTIPNFPSRLLSYMLAAKPVLACTDAASDVGEIIASGGFGWRCQSGDAAGFRASIEAALAAPCLDEMGERAFTYLDNYDAERQAAQILALTEPLIKAAGGGA